jgi:hypothetical protein
MNADKRRLKRLGLSVFIGVNRRLKMPFSDFFSSLLTSRPQNKILALRSAYVREFGLAK